MRRNFLKIGLAAAMTLTGVATIAPQKIVNAATLKAPIKRVQIDYLPGKDVKIWTNYQKGQLISFRAKNNSKWNVAETAVDKKGNLWYKIGDNEWIEARYTKDLDGEDNESNDKSANNKKDKKAKKQKQPKQTNKEVTPKPTSVTKKPKKPSQAPKNPSSLPAATAPAATGSAAQRQQAVVKLAKSQVGKGYVWGGNGPDAYDCSGLVQSIYSKVGGVQLPRVTTDQVKMGTTVSSISYWDLHWK